MYIQRAITCSVAAFLVLAATQTSSAGKLGSIRSAAKGNAKSTTPAPKRRTTPPTTPSPSSESQDDDTPPARAATPTRKLDSIRTAARQNESRPTRPAKRREPRRTPRSHRPRSHRSHLGSINFRAQYSPTLFPPTIIEEHHYYQPEPIIVAQPVVVPEPVMPEPYPPVVQAEPPCVRGASPQVEYGSESVVSYEDPFAWVEPFQIRFEIDYATDEADVSRSGFGLLLNATGGLGIDTGVRMFREHDADFRDHLWLGDFNVVYELFPNEFVRTRAGIGVNWLADQYGGEAGFNLTVGTDLFAGPVTFSGEVDLGTIGDTDLVHGRLTAAIRQGEHLEWFAGYDFLDIGGTEIRGVVGGMRFRF